MTAIAWIIIGWLALAAFTVRWFHVCKLRREAEEGVMRSVKREADHEYLRRLPR